MEQWSLQAVRVSPVRRAYLHFSASMADACACVWKRSCAFRRPSWTSGRCPRSSEVLTRFLKKTSLTSAPCRAALYLAGRCTRRSLQSQSTQLTSGLPDLLFKHVYSMMKFGNSQQAPGSASPVYVPWLPGMTCIRDLRSLIPVPLRYLAKVEFPSCNLEKGLILWQDRVAQRQSESLTSTLERDESKVHIH